MKRIKKLSVVLVTMILVSAKNPVWAEDKTSVEITDEEFTVGYTDGDSRIDSEISLKKEKKKKDKAAPKIVVKKYYTNKKRRVRIYAKDKSGVAVLKLYRGRVTSKNSPKWKKARKIKSGRRYTLKKNSIYSIYAKDTAGIVRIKRFSSAKRKTFRITAYCGCRLCNGRWYGQPTKSGRKAIAGKTLAVDPNIINLGDHVKIKGHNFRADDTGSAIKNYRIDMYFNSHTTGNRWGVKYLKVIY